MRHNQQDCQIGERKAPLLPLQYSIALIFIPLYTLIIRFSLKGERKDDNLNLIAFLQVE